MKARAWFSLSRQRLVLNIHGLTNEALAARDNMNDLLQLRAEVDHFHCQAEYYASLLKTHCAADYLTVLHRLGTDKVRQQYGGYQPCFPVFTRNAEICFVRAGWIIINFK